ncbi:MAG: hypothetical protein ACXV4C_07080 [Halobacteriota archaeon]
MYTEAAEINPSYETEAWIEEADKHLDVGKYENAARYYEKTATTDRLWT